MFNAFAFFVYVLVASITPGPNNILSMSQSGRIGFIKTFPFNLGVLFGVTGVAMLCMFLSLFMRDLVPVIMKPLVIIGAIYILYLAWKTYRSTSEIKSNEATVGFVSGTMLQFINPKAYIFSMLAFEGYVLPFYSENIPMLIAIAIFFAFCGFLCTLLWSGFGSAFRTLFTRYAKATNTIMASLLVYCAVSLFV